MNSKSESTLPPEVLDLIFSLLESDHLSLKACSRVNILFSVHVERHIYREVTVNNYPQAKRLYNVLLRKPHLTSMVQFLHVSVSVPLNASRSIRSIFGQRVAQFDKELSAIILSLTSLEGLTVRGNSDGAQVIWPRLDGRLRSAILHALRSPSLNNFTLESLDDFPLFSLKNWASARRLTLSKLHSVNVEPFDEPEASESGQGARADCSDICSLTITLCCPCILNIGAWAISSGISSQLRQLTMYSLGIGMHEGYQFVNACQNTLTTLELDTGFRFFNPFDHNTGTPGGNTSSMPIPLNLAEYPKLQHLCIHINIRFLEDIYHRLDGAIIETRRTSYSSVNAISQLLQTLPSPSTLRTLVLHVKIHVRMSTSSLPTFDWSPLERALSSACLVSADGIELKVSLGTPSKMKECDVVKLLKEDVVLSRMAARGVLNIREEKDWSPGLPWAI